MIPNIDGDHPHAMDRDPGRRSWRGHYTPDYVLDQNKPPNHDPPGNEPLIARTPVATAHQMHGTQTPLSQPVMAGPSSCNDSFGAPNDHESNVSRNRQGNRLFAGANWTMRGVAPKVHGHRSIPDVATDAPTEGTRHRFRLSAVKTEEEVEQIKALVRKQAHERARTATSRKAQEGALAQALVWEQSDANQMLERLQKHAKKRKEKQSDRLQCQQPQDDQIHPSPREEQERLYYLEKYDSIFGDGSHRKSARSTSHVTPPEGPTDANHMLKVSSPKTEAPPNFLVRSKVKTSENNPESLHTRKAFELAVEAASGPNAFHEFQDVLKTTESTSECLSMRKAFESVVEILPGRNDFHELETIEEATSDELDAIRDFPLPPTGYKTAAKSSQLIPTCNTSKSRLDAVIVPSGSGTTTKTASQPHVLKASEEQRSADQWAKWNEGHAFSDEFESLDLVSDVEDDWEEVEGELKDWEVLEK